MPNVVHFLLVDDSAEDRARLRPELLREFAESGVHEAADAEALARFLDAGGFDLVITEARLGWTDGLSVLRAVKACWPNCPVLVFTAKDSAALAVEALKNGVDDYVLKAPDQYRRLLDAIQAALRPKGQAEVAAPLRAGLQAAKVFASFADHRLRYVQVCSPPAGLTAEDLLGKRDDELLPPQEAARLMSLKRQVLDSGVGSRRELVLPFGGVRRVYDVSAEVSAGAAGVSVVAVDVTERKQAEEVLQETNRRKDEFVSMVAHELRNPLAPLRNAVQILQLPNVGPAEMAALRSMMERQLQHLVRLVEDLMDVSRLIRGKVELVKEWLDVQGIVAEAAEICRPLLEARRQELFLSLPAEPVRLPADRTRLVQIVANLLNNAVKYSEEGKRIWLTLTSGRRQVVLTVRDEGIGIPAELLPHVFELFAQADSSPTRSQGGLGVGLTVVRRLAEMHGGTVEVHSDGPGRGSVFILRLPLAAEPEGQPTAPADRDPGRVLDPARRILVVDDNIDAAESLALLLRFRKHAVLTAYDGAAALDISRTFRPEVILLDLEMPRMSGYEVARQLRQAQDRDQLMLVAMTGHGQEEDRLRSEQVGFDLHLVKPVDPGEVEKVVASFRHSPGERGA